MPYVLALDQGTTSSRATANRYLTRDVAPADILSVFAGLATGYRIAPA